jgi:hypothetical protein
MIWYTFINSKIYQINSKVYQIISKFWLMWLKKFFISKSYRYKKENYFVLSKYSKSLWRTGCPILHALSLVCAGGVVASIWTSRHLAMTVEAKETKSLCSGRIDVEPFPLVVCGHMHGAMLLVRLDILSELFCSFYWDFITLKFCNYWDFIMFKLIRSVK